MTGSTLALAALGTAVGCLIGLIIGDGMDKRNFKHLSGWTAKRASDPLVYGDDVVMYREVRKSGRGAVHAVDIDIGKELRKRKSISPTIVVTVDDDQLIVSMKSDSFVYDLVTGKELWRLSDAKLVGKTVEYLLFETGKPDANLRVFKRDGRR